MRFLVSNMILPESNAYRRVTPEQSLTLLYQLKTVGLDTETKGLDPYTKELLLLQLGNRDIQVVIDITTVDILIYKGFLESKDILFLGWNLKFDTKFLMHHNILIKHLYDGYIAEKLLWNGYPSGIHSLSLQSACRNYLNIELDKTVRGKIIWSKILTDDIIVYSARDVEHLEDIKDAQEKLLREKDLLKAVDFENVFVIICAYFEYCGVKLDISKWQEKMRMDKANVDKAVKELNSWVTTNLPDSEYVHSDLQGDLFSGFDTAPKCNINWSSSKQVVKLFKQLGFNLLVKDKRTGEMKYSVDAKVIKGQKEISTITEPYLRFKGYEKITSTYGQSVLDEINPVTHRLHTNFNQLGTDTNRLSSGGKDKENHIDYINMQNIPADELTRSCFIAEEGNLFISCDYSAQESRLMAELSNDEAMLDLFNNGCGDTHSLVCKMAFPEIVGDCPVEDVKKNFHELRNNTKSWVEFPIVLLFSFIF